MKKQQAYLRELEEGERPEWEKRQVVLTLSVGGGKGGKGKGKVLKTVTKTREAGRRPGGDEETEPNAHSQGMSTDTTFGGTADSGMGGGFGTNPLLSTAGLIRPIWTPTGVSGDDKGKQKTADQDSVRSRKSVWRRVQDDEEDNERWILDGGARGFGSGSTGQQGKGSGNGEAVVEDGGWQECG
jgi:hypothetical protein